MQGHRGGKDAQAIARLVPASYVFENMRAVLSGCAVSWPALAVAGALDLAYVLVAVLYLGHALRHARRHGRLSRFGDQPRRRRLLRRSRTGSLLPLIGGR